MTRTGPGAGRPWGWLAGGALSRPLPPRKPDQLAQAKQRRLEPVERGEQGEELCAAVHAEIVARRKPGRESGGSQEVNLYGSGPGTGNGAGTSTGATPPR